MTRAPKPIIHNTDHEHGGPDVVRIHWEDVGTSGGGGTGIQFDIANVGGWLSIEVTGDSGAGRGVLLEADTGDILVSADTNDIEIDSGVDTKLFPGRDFILSANRDVAITADGDIALRANADSISGGNIIISGLPTTNPGVTGALWNNGGVLSIS